MLRGMMTLVALAISVAYFYSPAVMVTSTLLALVVIPTTYYIWRGRRLTAVQ
jgi:cation transport ATPase